jgi:dihydropyrimidine dehydrogenase (NAD+) subunit PreA
MDGSDGVDGQKYAKLARMLEEAGADMIEINMSCPLPLMGDSAHQEAYPTDFSPEVSSWMKSLGLTSTLGDIPSAITHVVKAVVEAVKCPVGPKPSPEIGFPRMAAILKTIANAGAKYAVNISNPLSVAPPDIYRQGKGKYPAFGDLNPLAGVIGPMNRCHAIKCLVAGSLFVPELDYAIAGGIVTPEHMVEAMMLGAKQIQISSGLYWEGIKIIPRFISFLVTYMNKQSYESVNDFVGLGLQYIKPVDENTDFGAYQAVARIDVGKCTQCGKCAPNFCFALSRDALGNSIVDERECIACGLCAAICPFDAISIEDR